MRSHNGEDFIREKAKKIRERGKKKEDIHDMKRTKEKQ